MNQGRRILLTGLPAGVGVSSVALALADVLVGLNRRVRLVAPFKDLISSQKSSLAAVELPYGTLLRGADGVDRFPLETLQPASATPAIEALNQNADIILIDRFTGLNLESSPWYEIADELLLIVDGRADQSLRSLAFLGKIKHHWPNLPVRFLINRIPVEKSRSMAILQLRTLFRDRLGLSPECLATFHESKDFRRATRDGIPVTRLFPNSPAARMFRQMARQLLITTHANQAVPGFRGTDSLPTELIMRNP